MNEAMSLRQRAIIFFKHLGIKSEPVRKTEEVISIPKSSVYRLRMGQKRRIAATGHHFFETEEGLAWLHRLFIAVLLVFGIQSGVGSVTISLFFNLILVGSYIAISPSSIKNSKQKMRAGIEAFGVIQMLVVLKQCENKELHLGGDETTFGANQFLILMELTSGFIFTEALVTDRKEATWKKHTESLLKPFKKILSFASDGGKALLNLGKVYLCDNTMDLFHFLKDMRSLFATKFHSKRRALTTKLEKIKKSGATYEDKAAAEKEINDGLLVLDNGQKQYRQCLFTVSTQVHPFKNIVEPKSSLELKSELHEQVELLRRVAKECSITDKYNLLQRAENRVEPCSLLNDLWHSWVDASLLCNISAPEVQAWAKEVLLPYYYWKQQAKKSKRKERLRDYYQDIESRAKAALDAHPLTQEHLIKSWIQWAVAMVNKYQRTTSAIEGRNARLTHYYFATRGVRASHVTALTVLHNFWIRREDNSSAATRLCGTEFPDMFDWLLKYMPEMPLPRKAKPRPLSLVA